MTTTSAVRRTLLPLALCLLASVGAAAAERPVSASDLPAELQKPFAALIEAPAARKETACDALIGAYLPRLRAGEGIALVDQTIVGALSAEGRAALVARLAISGVFSPLQKTCIAENERATLTGLAAEYVETARGLYEALEILSRGEPRRPADWARIAAALRSGWRYFPSSLYAGQLERALRRSKDRRGLFEFTAYRYLDESDPNALRDVGLFLRWLFLPGKQRYAAEIARVKASIKADILRTSPGVAGLPRFGADTFFSGDGTRLSLAFADPESVLYRRRAVVCFFETTCPYCVAELEALGRLLPAYEARCPGVLAVVGVKKPTPLPPSIDALGPFAKRLAVPFPLLENATSGVFAAYGVRAVPLLVFFDEAGLPLWTVVLRGQGRLDEKLSWFLDDLLADRRPAREAGSAPSPLSVPVDCYLDPSCTDCRMFVEHDLPVLARSLDADVEVVTHDLGDARVADALENRLAALRLIRSEPLVVIVGTKAVQGLAAAERGLPAALAHIAAGQHSSRR